MHLIVESNVIDYLAAQGHLAIPSRATAVTLSGGVSNVVLRISTGDDQPDFIVKQVREQLRTPDPWFSRPARIFNEIEVLKILADLLEPGIVPRILFEDRENFLFAMEAAPADHRVWKAQLLHGEADLEIARQLGTILAVIHRETWGDESLARRLGDLTMFDELRLDPYYRRLWRDHPDDRPILQRLIDDPHQHRSCLVLGDFSPKNILVHSRGLTVVDFETGHYGDPAFDLGFFLSHLFLKTLLHADRSALYLGLIATFLEAYDLALHEPNKSGQKLSADERKGVESRGTLHLAGCMWARIDGTSRVDYLSEYLRARARTFARNLLNSPASDWPAAIDRFIPSLEDSPAHDGT